MTNEEVNDMNEFFCMAIEEYNSVLEDEAYNNKNPRNCLSGCRSALEAVVKAILIAKGSYIEKREQFESLKLLNDEGVIPDGEIFKMFTKVRLAGNEIHPTLEKEKKGFSNDIFEIVLVTDYLIEWTRCVLDDYFVLSPDEVQAHINVRDGRSKKLADYRLNHVRTALELKEAVEYKEPISKESAQRVNRGNNQSSDNNSYEAYRGQYSYNDTSDHAPLSVGESIKLIAGVVVVLIVLGFVITIISMLNEEGHPANPGKETIAEDREPFSVVEVLSNEIIEREESKEKMNSDSVVVSSDNEYKDKKGNVYKATNLVDRDISTSWKGKKGNQEDFGTIKIRFTGENPNYIAFINGDQKNEKEYQKYSRAKKVFIHCGDIGATVWLKDTSEKQWFKVFGVEDGDELSFEIKSVFPGGKKKDVVAISELEATCN